MTPFKILSIQWQFYCPQKMTHFWAFKKRWCKWSRSIEPKMAPLKCAVQWGFAPKKWPFLRSQSDEAKSIDTRAVCWWSFCDDFGGFSALLYAFLDHFGESHFLSISPLPMHCCTDLVPIALGSARLKEHTLRVCNNNIITRVADRSDLGSGRATPCLDYHCWI